MNRNHNRTNLYPNYHRKLIHLRGSKIPYVNSSIADGDYCDLNWILIKLEDLFSRVSLISAPWQEKNSLDTWNLGAYI